MLGLLLFAGLGLAATAFVELVDKAPSDEEEAEDEAEPEGEGDLLDGEEAEPAPVDSLHGGAADDSLVGGAGRDFIDGQGGDDILSGQAGQDQLVGFEEGQDTLYGGADDDILHGYALHAPPDGDASFLIEDQEADDLQGGAGNDLLYLATADIGTGGEGADAFHLSWDVDTDQPATIQDYQPGTDKIVIEFTSHRADDDMTEITQADQEVSTTPLADGSGTAIQLNGQTIATVLGTTSLQASDIAVLHR